VCFILTILLQRYPVSENKKWIAVISPWLQRFLVRCVSYQRIIMGISHYRALAFIIHECSAAAGVVLPAKLSTRPTLDISKFITSKDQAY
jgi:hypothetical protein